MAREKWLTFLKAVMNFMVVTGHRTQFDSRRGFLKCECKLENDTVNAVCVNNQGGVNIKFEQKKSN